MPDFDGPNLHLGQRYLPDWREQLWVCGAHELMNKGPAQRTGERRENPRSNWSGEDKSAAAGGLEGSAA
jgi:hypothetical protein